jgi:hypothetical protein
MERLGLRPGIRIVVETGLRNASLLVRIGGQTGAVRLSQELAGEISVVPDGSVFVAPGMQA